MDVCICKWLLSAQATILFEFLLRNRFIFVPEMKCMQQEVLDALFLAYTNFLIYRMIWERNVCRDDGLFILPCVP